MSRSSALPSVFVWILLVVRDFSACELDRCWGGHHPWCDTFVRSINLEWGSACSVGSNRPFALGSKHRCCLSLRSAASVNHCQARGHFICFMRSFLHIAGFVSVNHVHPKQQFDATKGYPGEGPEEKHLWSIYSANIGSLKTASCWKTWESAITCMQETRIGKNCINSARHSVAQCGKTLFPGALLPGLLASNGVRRTPSRRCRSCSTCRTVHTVC